MTHRQTLAEHIADAVYRLVFTVRADHPAAKWI